MIESLSLKGKTVIATGGGLGLGKEMVLAMANMGADIVIAASYSLRGGVSRPEGKYP